MRRPFSWWFHHRHRTDDAFVQRPVTGNFYQSATWYPMPFACITTVDDDGATSIAPYSLAFPFDVIEQPSLMLVARSSANTVRHIERTGTAALNYIEYDKDWLEAVVRLGYPGQTSTEKMSHQPFELEPSPTPGRAADFPMLMKDAFQVFECRLDRDFVYRPPRDSHNDNAERFMLLRIENILLRERFDAMLEAEDDFPHMPISYGFRHQTGERRFWFCAHEQPFGLPLPTDIGPPHQTIFYEANRIDPAVQFTEEACMPLTSIPKPFLKMALRGIITQAKADGVALVDAAYIDKVDAQRRGH